jgi:PHP family Zn ribbon phosphoesterase
MQVNADLHIHGRYSIGVSKYMTPENLALGSKRKGIQLLGTGDCLHEDWLKGFEDLEKIDDGTYAFGDTRFVLTASYSRPRSRILQGCIMS